MQYDTIIELNNLYAEECEYMYKTYGLYVELNDGQVINLKIEDKVGE